MSDLLYPDWPQAELRTDQAWATEQVGYETGWVQRNALWSAPMHRFRLAYGVLLPAEYAALRDFYLQHRGVYEAFWFADFTEAAVTGRRFGTGDGATTVFKLPIDSMAAVTVYVAGVPTAVVADLAQGRITFAAAPANGTALTFDATTPRYRVRFGNDALSLSRHRFMAWGAEVELLQVRFDS